MEDPVKEQPQSSAATGNDGKSKLRYPLRSSAAKLKPDKSPPITNSVSAHKRERATSSVSKSVSVLNLSANDKSLKPPRRLSIPSKPSAVPRPKPSSSITPVSESRVRRSLASQGKSDTPVSDVSKSSARRKFNALSSASYWLSQIKLSESVPNHAVSLGFFKLAVEAGCEPLQRLCDELKSYVLKHNVSQLEETVKTVFEIYGITETLEQMQVSEACSHVPEEGSMSSVEAVQGTNSPVGARKLKSKSLNTEVCEVSSGKESIAKSIAPKSTAASRLPGSLNRKSATPKPASENGAQNIKRNSRKVSKQISSNGQDKKKQEKKSAGEAPSKAPETEEVAYENKENMDAAALDEIRVTEGN